MSIGLVLAAVVAGCTPAPENPADLNPAARGFFARFGYEGATVRRLEEATGLSRGAIFHHFRDKDSLFLAVAESLRVGPQERFLG